MGKIVRVTLDQLPPISEERRRELNELAERPDSEIDFADIPELTEEFWKNARPLREVMEERRARRSEKVTVSLDGDVLAWLQRDDERLAESRVNDLLRKAMVNDLLKKSA